MATNRRHRRWYSLLLRVVLGAALLYLYCVPLCMLEHDDIHGRRSDTLVRAASMSAANKRAEQFQDQRFMRMWLTFALTLYALCGVISKQVMSVSMLHALVHVARAVSTAPPIIATPSMSLRSIMSYWQTHSIKSCAFEYSSLLSFALLLRYVLFPPPSALATFERHSRNLKAFFKLHGRKFVPLVDRLLEEYTGHERLLYARIRRLYCTGHDTAATSVTTASSESIAAQQATPTAVSQAKAAVELQSP